MMTIFLTVSGHWEDVLYHLGIIRYGNTLDFHIFSDHIIVYAVLTMQKTSNNIYFTLL